MNKEKKSWAHCPYTGEQEKVSSLPLGWKWGKFPSPEQWAKEYFKKG